MSTNGDMRLAEAVGEHGVDAYLHSLLAGEDLAGATSPAAQGIDTAAPVPMPPAAAADACTFAPTAQPSAEQAPSGEPAAPQPVAKGPATAPAAPAPARTAACSVELAEDVVGQVASGHRWLRVTVGEDLYAVELLRVQEVVRVVPVIAVRGAVPSLLGVMNLRGRIVPVHDLGRWLRAGHVSPDERARIVVLEHKDELTGLLVSTVSDVITLDAAQVEPPTRGTRDRTGLGIARTPGAPPTVLLDACLVFD